MRGQGVSGAPNKPESQIGADAVESGGYEQELKRTLGSFQVFAVSFAFISVAVGVFGTYGVVLQSAGPIGIWLWILVAAGQVLVALVIAQFAARIPLSGAAYQWASRLANPKVGWWFGWLSVCYLSIAVVAMDNALVTQVLMPLFGLPDDEGTTRLITLVVVLVQVLLVISSTRIVAIISSAAVGLELVIVVAIALALGFAVVFSGDGHVSNLVSHGIAENDPSYYAVGGGLMVAMVLGLGTLVGFDAAANLAEEAKDPYRSVPRAIVGSVVAAGILGFVFLAALTIAIKDIPAASASDSPVALIIGSHLGPVLENLLLIAIAIAFFGAGMVVMTSCSRMVFAMARDSRFPAHTLMRRVNPRTRTPIPATVLVFVIVLVLMLALPGKALLELIVASTILPALIYGLTIVLYLVVRKRLDARKGAFSLGRFEVPVVIAALVWVAFALFTLVTPPGTLISVAIVAGLCILGGLYFGWMFFFNRDALESEPGDADSLLG